MQDFSTKRGARPLTAQGIDGGHILALGADTPIWVEKTYVHASELREGDNVGNRFGQSTVLSNTMIVSEAPMIHLAAGAIGCSAKWCLPADQFVIVDDWRVEMLFSQRVAVFSIKNLVGLEGVTQKLNTPIRLNFLVLSAPAPLAVGGLGVTGASSYRDLDGNYFACGSRSEAALWGVIRDANFA